MCKNKETNTVMVLSTAHLLALFLAQGSDRGGLRPLLLRACLHILLLLLILPHAVLLDELDQRVACL